MKSRPSRLTAFGLSALLSVAFAGGAFAEPVKYSLPKGISVPSVKSEMKKEDGRELAFVSVSVKNDAGEDRPYEIELAGDDGLLITTYTGGPKKEPLKVGAQETAVFKTLLTKLPERLEVTVRPYSD